MTIDLAEYTLEGLHELQSQVIQEIDRREQAGRVAEQIRDLTMQLLDSTGREMRAAWVAPVGAHDSYPVGWEVTHGEKIWRSLVAGNVWEPGDTTIPTHAMLWEEVVVEEPEAPVEPEEPEEPGEEPTDPTEPEEPVTPNYPEWAQPTSAQDAYNRDDIVSHQGILYRSLIDGNVWSPTDYAAGWEVAA